MLPAPRSPHSLHDHTLDLLCRRWSPQDRLRLAKLRPRNRPQYTTARHNNLWETIQEEVRSLGATTPCAA